MSARTVFLSKLIGLFALLMAAAMYLHHQAMLDFIANAPAMMIAGMIALGLGLAMVLGHNVWSGGALPVVVTLVGWLFLLKGAFLMFVAPDTVSAMIRSIGFEQHYSAFLITPLILGLYLTYSGFRARN